MHFKSFDATFTINVEKVFTEIKTYKTFAFFNNFNLRIEKISFIAIEVIIYIGIRMTCYKW
jgi:hypothetical protein